MSSKRRFQCCLKDFLTKGTSQLLSHYIAFIFCQILPDRHRSEWRASRTANEARWQWRGLFCPGIRAAERKHTLWSIAAKVQWDIEWTANYFSITHQQQHLSRFLICCVACAAETPNRLEWDCFVFQPSSQFSELQWRCLKNLLQ